jgi:hypothetical protein
MIHRGEDRVPIPEVQPESKAGSQIFQRIEVILETLLEIRGHRLQILPGTAISLL